MQCDWRLNPIQQERKKDNPWKILALYGSLSMNLACMVVGGFYLGKMLELYYRWKNMKVYGILAGLFLGLYQLFSFAYRSVEKK